MEVKFKVLNVNASHPAKQSAGAAGFDLSTVKQITVPANYSVTVPLGLAFEIPEGYEGQLRMRSSMAQDGLILLNGVGTIDSDYRGEVKAIVHNTTDTDIILTSGTRLVQLIITQVPNITLVKSDTLTSTLRGSFGFGSTGK